MFQNIGKNTILLGLVVVLALGLVFSLFGDKLGVKKSDYSVVYLTTGEVYVGKLSTFPDFTLTDSYILTTAKDEKDPSKSNFQLNPIKEALWAPKVLHLMRDQIIFYGPISESSKIGQTLNTQTK